MGFSVKNCVIVILIMKQNLEIALLDACYYFFD